MSIKSLFREKYGALAFYMLPWVTDGVVFVNEVEDFGEAVDGVITLEAGKTFQIISNIDLMGDRLEAGGVVTLMGTSSETCSITSTGLPDEVPLLTSRHTIPMRFLTIKDVHTAVYIDDDSGANAPLAIDWFGVNFSDVTVVGEVGNVSNFIYDTGALLNSQGLSFTGEVGTVGFSNSLYQGDGSADSIISIADTCTITRRFRVAYSAFVVFGSSVGLTIGASATIPIEGLILDTVNFSGGSTYVSGITVDDPKARWLECRGISNSASLSNYYMNGNTTATVISTIDQETKILGSTSSAVVTQKFTNTDNRATYIGEIVRDFKVSAVASAESGNNNQVGLYIAKNGSVVPSSEVYITTNASGRAENGFCQAIIELSQDDYIEVFVENSTSTNNVIITELNVIIEALN